MPVLKLDKHDEDREISFELEFHQSLSLPQRFHMLEERKIHFIKQLIAHGHRAPVEIIKRP